jgi:hypothetical protein
VTALVLQVLVVGFAAFRLARVIAQDTITDPARRWLWERSRYAVDVDGPPQGISLKRLATHGHSRLARDRSSVIDWVYGLVSCPFCCGWWIALGLFFAWQGWGWTNLLAGIAAAGVQATLAAVTQ